MTATWPGWPSVPWSRVARAAGEVVVAFLAAEALIALCRRVSVDPLTRIGQVSGLAAAQFRYAALALVVVAVAAVGLNRFRGSAHESLGRDLVVRLSCAAAAGLASGVAAGGIDIALHGTPWGLNAQGGDAGRLMIWAHDVLNHTALPDTYPPFPPYAIAGLSKLTGDPVEYAMKTYQILGVATLGPLAYLAWRMVLTPVWALVIGVTSALPLTDAYKSFTNVVLVVLVPLLVKALLCLRDAGAHGYIRALLVGALVGVGMALLFWGYFGWFLWSSPGLGVAVLLLFPWRDLAAALKALTLVVTAGVVFLAVAHKSVFAIVSKGGGDPDTYFYFDTYVRPTFFARWFDDRPPPNLGPWPPPGGLGGVDIFSVLLFAGLVVALVLGHRRVDVLLISTLVAGAWLLRMWLASRMSATGNVQLYPRTSVQILYGLLLATGLAVMLAVRSAARLGTGSGVAARLRPGALVGVLAGMFLLYASMGDATADDYMPRNDTSNGQLAYRAHTTYELNGTCPLYTKASGYICAPTESYKPPVKP